MGQTRIHCPKCKAVHRSRVIRTYSRGKQIRRIRECLHCLCRWRTVEQMDLNQKYPGRRPVHGQRFELGPRRRKKPPAPQPKPDIISAADERLEQLHRLRDQLPPETVRAELEQLANRTPDLEPAAKRAGSRGSDRNGADERAPATRAEEVATPDPRAERARRKKLQRIAQRIPKFDLDPWDE